MAIDLQDRIYGELKSIWKPFHHHEDVQGFWEDRPYYPVINFRIREFLREIEKWETNELKKHET